MKENIKLRRRKDLIGKVFGRLTVLGPGQIRTLSRGMYWLCKCECGVIKEIGAQALVRGSTVSCGCYKIERPTLDIKHGHNRRNGKKSPTYISWTKMNDRCNSQNASEYKWYGGRGVSICDRWKSFNNFLQDMGERPKGTSLDRIDVNGNYEPSNCKWSNIKEQANNTQRNIFITHNGQTKTVAVWADCLGLKYDTLFARLYKYGWPIEVALASEKYKPIPNKPVISKTERISK